MQDLSSGLELHSACSVPALFDRNFAMQFPQPQIITHTHTHTMEASGIDMGDGKSYHSGSVSQNIIHENDTKAKVSQWKQ